MERTTVDSDDDDGEDGDSVIVGSFHGVPVPCGWLVVGENVENEAKGKKQTLYTWEARDPYDCINDLITLCDELKEELQSRYNNIIPDEVKQMGTIFDFEDMIVSLSKFIVEDGKLSISKANHRDWDTCGREEFKKFYMHVCNLPHIAHLSELNQELELFAHSSDLVLRNLKTGTIQGIIWHRQSNDVLMHRAVVDWCIPQPLTCRQTMIEIGKLYFEGSKVLGISKHRSAVFSDVRERAAKKYKVSKVVDRIATEEPRCPHVLKTSQN